MGRQKMISTSKLGEIIDLMREKRVAKLTIPDTVEILLFEPEITGTGFSIDDAPGMGETKNMSEMDLLLHSAT